MNEQSIQNTVDDFHKFCGYIEENKPVLTRQKTQLGKKDLFEINALLHFRKEVSAPNYQQESYLVINLMFQLAVGGKLYRKTADAKGNILLAASPVKEQFDKLKVFEQYAFLFETFWCAFDFLEIIRFGSNPVDKAINTIAHSTSGKHLKKGAFSKQKDYDPMFSYLSVLIHYWRYHRSRKAAIFSKFRLQPGCGAKSSFRINTACWICTMPFKVHLSLMTTICTHFSWMGKGIQEMNIIRPTARMVLMWMRLALGNWNYTKGSGFYTFSIMATPGNLLCFWRKSTRPPHFP